MRNKILCLLFTFIIIPSLAFAEEVSGTSASWSDISGAENSWDGQKMITNKEYEQVVNELEKRKNAKKIKAQKKAGNPLMKSGNGEMDFLSNFQEQYPLLNLTVPVVTQSGEIPVGHYKVVGTRNNGKVVINFCQAYNVIGKIQAIETEDDFDSNEINFVKIEPVSNDTLKLMYGSMNFNAYAYVKYENP